MHVYICVHICIDIYVYTYRWLYTYIYICICMCGGTYYGLMHVGIPELQEFTRFCYRIQAPLGLQETLRLARMGAGLTNPSAPTSFTVFTWALKGFLYLNFGL